MRADEIAPPRDDRGLEFAHPHGGGVEQRTGHGAVRPAAQGLTNFNVMRSLSPMARYFSRSFSPRRSVGGNVQTPAS